MVFPVIGIGLFKSSISGCTRSVCNAVGMEYGNGVAVSVPVFLNDIKQYCEIGKSRAFILLPGTAFRFPFLI